jgi:hypothetical protein
LTEQEQDSIHSALTKRVIRVVFHKKNGDLRTMNCTQNIELIPLEDRPSADDAMAYVAESSSKSIKVYDVDVKGWRSFFPDKVIAYNLEP